MGCECVNEPKLQRVHFSDLQTPQKRRRLSQERLRKETQDSRVRGEGHRNEEIEYRFFTKDHQGVRGQAR